MDWIKVSEQLPEEGVRVLVFRGEDSFYNPCIAKYHVITGRESWWSFEPGFFALPPTHWMPLPPNPQIKG